MRRYFPNLYGNEAVRARLGSAVERGTLAHAFLITGPDGSGKNTLATELVAALNCERRFDDGASLPCHTCNTCRRIAEGNFTDIMRLSRSSSKSTIGVEEVRLLKEDCYLSPTESSIKAYIIEDAERLTPNAQNALLKVLEEPPENVIILLLATVADRILTTVKSRAQSVAMQRFDTEKLRSYLIENNDKARLYAKVSPELLDGIVMTSDGRIGQALALLSEKEAKENAENRALIEQIIRAMRHGAPYSELYAAISRLPAARDGFCDALEAVICAVRDVTLVRLAPSVPLLFYASSESARDAAQDMNTKRLLALYEILKCALEDAGKNVSVGAITADLGAKIKFI